MIYFYDQIEMVIIQKHSHKSKKHKKESKHSSSHKHRDSPTSSSSDHSSSDDDCPRSSITGKKIKMHIDKTISDQINDINRAALRHSMNSQY